MRLNLPPALREALLGQLLEKRSLIHALLGPGGTILEAGGDLAGFGLEALEPGSDIEAVLQPAFGLLPLEGNSLVVPSVRVTGHVVADLHLFRVGVGYGLVLLETSERDRREAAAVSKANELTFRLHQLGHDANDRVGEVGPARPSQPDWGTAGDYRTVAVLAVRPRWPPEKLTPGHADDMVRIVARTVAAVSQTTKGRGGLVEVLPDGTALAIFGFGAPAASRSPLTLAVEVARDVMQAQAMDPAEPGIGLGIAIGDVLVVGEESQKSQALAAAGPCMLRAVCLADDSHGNCLLLDDEAARDFDLQTLRDGLTAPLASNSTAAGVALRLEDVP